MSTEQITRGRRQFLTTLGRGGLTASLMGGGVLGPWGAVNTALGQPLPGPLRIHGNPVATRDKDMKPFKQQYDVDLQIQLSVTHTETVTRIYSGATRQFDLFTLQHPFIKKLARDRMILPIEESKIANIDNPTTTSGGRSGRCTTDGSTPSTICGATIRSSTTKSTCPGSTAGASSSRMPTAGGSPGATIRSR